MRTWGIIVALIVAAIVAIAVNSLLPPRSLRMAAGPAGGAYEQVALKYRQILKRDGLDLEIIETAGSAANIALLEEGGADVAILQGGISSDWSGIEAIASIFYEPIILLVPRGRDIPYNPRHWEGLRINIGTVGSGTAAAYRDFALAVQIPGNANTVMNLPYDEAISKLSSGEIDIAFFVAPLEAPYLQDAYFDPDIRLLPLDYADAIARRVGYAQIVTIPAGGIAFDRVRPATPRQLLALNARLVSVLNLHPALVNRLTMAALEIHSQQGLITDRGTFPSVSGTDLPVNNAARQLIVEGPSLWHDWLPYWLAAQLNRVVILLLPVIFILLPLLQALPGIFAYLMGRRVWQYYPAIRDLEAALKRQNAPEDLVRMQTELAAIDARLAQMKLPAPYRSDAYNARIHIDLVQGRIRTRLEEAAAG